MTSNSNSGDSSPPSSEEETEIRSFFDTMAQKMCWSKAETVPGRHPDRWRKDADGIIVCKPLSNCDGLLCFEYAPIIPYSQGGEYVGENCQIRSTSGDILKSDKQEAARLKAYAEKDLDLVEFAVYGDVIKPGNNCLCKTVAELVAKFKSKD